MHIVKCKIFKGLERFINHKHFGNKLRMLSWSEFDCKLSSHVVFKNIKNFLLCSIATCVNSCNVVGRVTILNCCDNYHALLMY